VPPRFPCPAAAVVNGQGKRAVAVCAAAESV